MPARASSLLILGPDALIRSGLEQNLEVMFDTLASNPTIGLARQGNLVHVSVQPTQLSLLEGGVRCEGVARFATPDHRNQVSHDKRGVDR